MFCVDRARSPCYYDRRSSPPDPKKQLNARLSMKRTKRVLLLTALTALAPVAHASAQSPSVEAFGLFNLSAGSQVQTRSCSSTTTFPLYDETATVKASQQVGKGLLIDASGGYKVWRRLHAGLGLSLTRG